MLGSSPTVSPAARRRAAVRDEILEAAWSLCREHGLASLSLRDLAARVGMRAPSLYSYFAGKDAIYDAMFAQGQRELLASQAALRETDLTVADLHRGAHDFFLFCLADPTRYLLMFQRVVPGFVPSEESYALAVEVLAGTQRRLAAMGVTDPRHHDLFTALMTGLVDQQLSNDPGGDRWLSILPDALDMYAAHVGIARSTEGKARP